MNWVERYWVKRGSPGQEIYCMYDGEDINEKVLWSGCGWVLESTFLDSVYRDNSDAPLFTREVRHWIRDELYYEPSLWFKDNTWDC